MKKKGFTLVELLAVIAILAILVIMALPAVLRMFNSARKDSFTNEVNTVIRTARQQYLLSGGTDTTWSNAEGSTSTLDLTGNSQLKYYVQMNNEGKIIKLQVTNGDFQYNVTNNNGIDIAESSDVEIVTDSNQLDINSTGSNLVARYYAEGDTAYNTYQEAIESWNMPFFIKKEYKERKVWCIIEQNTGYNSCDDENIHYFLEHECNEEWQSWGNAEGYSFTCDFKILLEDESLENACVGFVKDDNVYCLQHINGNYDTNKEIIVNAFGIENCTGDLAMINSKKSLMNILGILDVDATGTPRATCNGPDFSVYINGSDVKIYNGTKRCSARYGSEFYCGTDVDYY